MNRKIRKFFIIGAYRSYGNLARFFMRMFAGILFMQFGIRQMANYDFFSEVFPSILGMGSELTLIAMIVIELLFSTLVIFGFVTRIAAVPPMISMIVAEYYLLAGNIIDLSAQQATQSGVFASMQLGYVPIMFVGMFFFIILGHFKKI